ncbi:hypothetical protein [Streptomyces canus]|uniref:hypothetical protein n=1 Tax=Streptomyces canus TaxID=58343 RepID=UPI003248DDB7
MTNRLSPEREAEIAEESPAVAAMVRFAETTGAIEGDDLKGLYRIATDLYAELNAARAELAAVRKELERRTEDVAFLERATLPELRRTIEHHKDGKQRWRDRAEKAEARLSAVLDLCDREQRNAIRWENPVPVPDWVAAVQRAALGDGKRTEATS